MKNILIIDDEEPVLRSLKRTLNVLGHEATMATSPQEGIEVMKTNEFDFILVDFMMPDNNGIWFMQNADIPKKTKVLLITAHVNRQVINEMFKLGASGYLIKPFDADEISMHLSFHSEE